ncbi:MAG: hypothetical protein OEZ39_05175 [Gammaproteobacteria bacterium]|nr:hypothetical protein [Gammaproteobacteria bacterium]MDH5651245.1 hypothetical protein [Gammaproteobacteria bacterium]
MSKTEAVPGLKAASMVAIARSLVNIDFDMSNDYYWEAYAAAYELGRMAACSGANCPKLLTLYELDDVFFESLYNEAQAMRAEQACYQCDQRHGQCYSGCPFV